MPICIPKREIWTRQPQYPVRAQDGRVIIALLPGVADSIVGGIRDFSLIRSSPVITGTTPTGTPFGINKWGRYLISDLRGGSYGIANIAWPTSLHKDAEPLTIIWAGQVVDVNYTSMAARGTTGSDWSVKFYYTSTTLVGGYVDNPVTGENNTTLSGLSISNGSYQRAAYRKIGNTVTVFDWNTKTTSTLSQGNGSFRTPSGYGLQLGVQAASGAYSLNRTNAYHAMNVGLADAEVWAMLDNPWQIFAP